MWVSGGHYAGIWVNIMWVLGEHHVSIGWTSCGYQVNVMGGGGGVLDEHQMISGGQLDLYVWFLLVTTVM